MPKFSACIYANILLETNQEFSDIIRNQLFAHMPYQRVCFSLSHDISSLAINIAADIHISNSLFLSDENRNRNAISRSFCDSDISSCNYDFFIFIFTIYAIFSCKRVYPTDMINCFLNLHFKVHHCRSWLLR